MSTNDSDLKYYIRQHENPEFSDCSPDILQSDLDVREFTFYPFINIFKEYIYGKNTSDFIYFLRILALMSKKNFSGNSFRHKPSPSI